MSAAAAQTVAALTERRKTMARIAHLVPRKQVEIERAVRLLRVHFIDRRPRAPKRGILHRITLVGPFAQPSDKVDCETGEINAYDLWAFVDHPAYRGRNRHWGLARRVVEAALRGRATITLLVFTLDEIERWRAVGNGFLAEQYSCGVTLYERAAATGEGAVN